MNENSSALYSEYIIDGVQQDLTPARILDSCAVNPESSPDKGDYVPVVDETLDLLVTPVVLDSARMEEYCSAIVNDSSRPFPMWYPETFSRFRIAQSLITLIWREGHFKLEDLGLNLRWEWNDDAIGNMTNFYSSVCSAADLIDSLGLKINTYIYKEGAVASFDVSASLSDDDSLFHGSSFMSDLSFSDTKPVLKEEDRIPHMLVPDPKSWIIYVPFDQCDYHLGASLVCQKYGLNGSDGSHSLDSDYFIDCYEVIRELVEDRVAIAGASVGDGGLISTLKRMTINGTGASIELSDLVSASGEKDIMKLLFAEVPGVVIQIADIDYDYVDAELLLQDVAFFPLGHPLTDSCDLRIHSSERSGIQNILNSIINSQNSEGED